MDDRRKDLIITTVIFTSVALLIVVVRLWARLRIFRNAGFDDAVIALAMGLSLGFLVCTCVEVHYGLGKHVETLTLIQTQEIYKFDWMSGLIYSTTLIVVKTSVLSQYRRLFVGTVIQRVCKITLGFILLYGTWIFLASIFGCQPINAFWNHENPKGHCFNEAIFYFTNAGFNIITDIFILAIPMPAFNKLQLPRKQKLGLIGIFAVGGFVCITSILRLHALHVSFVSKDPTWDSATATIWSAVESNLAIICACLPTLKPVVALVFPHLLSGTCPVSYRDALLSTRRVSNAPTSYRQSYRQSHRQSYRQSHRHMTSRLSVASSNGTQGMTGETFALGGVKSGQSFGDEEGGKGEIKVVTVLAQEVEGPRDSDSRRL